MELEEKELVASLNLQDEVESRLSSIQDLVKDFLEDAIARKAKSFGERLLKKQLLDVAAASTGGASVVAASLAENAEIQWKDEVVKVEVPSVTVGMGMQTVGQFDVPQVTMKVKTIAKFDVLEIVMTRQRGPDIPQFKCSWSGCRLWMKKTYLHVPKERWRTQEIKTSVPELTWKTMEIKTELPSARVEMRSQSFTVPVPVGVKVDLEGFVFDAIPASQVLKEILAQLQEAKDFLDEYRAKAEELLDGLIAKAVREVEDKLDSFSDEIEEINDEYEEIVRKLASSKASAKEKLAEIQKANSEKLKMAAEINEKIKPLRDALTHIENTRDSILDTILNIPFPSL